MMAIVAGPLVARGIHRYTASIGDDIRSWRVPGGTPC